MTSRHLRRIFDSEFGVSPVAYAQTQRLLLATILGFFGAVAYQWYVYYLVGYAVCLHRLYIIQFPPKDVLAREFWEHPFAKKNTGKELIGAQPALASKS